MTPNSADKNVSPKVRVCFSTQQPNTIHRILYTEHHHSNTIHRILYTDWKVVQNSLSWILYSCMRTWTREVIFHVLLFEEIWGWSSCCIICYFLVFIGDPYIRVDSANEILKNWRIFPLHLYFLDSECHADENISESFMIKSKIIFKVWRNKWSGVSQGNRTHISFRGADIDCKITVKKLRSFFS